MFGIKKKEKQTRGKSPRSVKRAKGAKKRPGRHMGPYSPEQRRQAVEAYLKSGLTQQEFAKVWGTSPGSLFNWVKAYKESGPKGLENTSYLAAGKKRGPKGLPAPVKQEITEIKQQNPGFGFKKVQDFLYRFRGVKVSKGSVRKTLKEAEIPPLPMPKRRARRSKEVRRFERARPMQLWQTDITSFVLARHSTRVYLTVFMDDHSRYVVSWSLALKQTKEFVMETLLQGVQRFGKPEEVLTDQGRQYYSVHHRTTPH